MPAQLKYGTAGATGGGFSGWQGIQPLFREERRDTKPDWSWQRRSAKTLKDRNAWYSCWSFGCRIGNGISGSDGDSVHNMTCCDLFEPYSCDGEGTQSKRFILGITKDSVGTAIANVTVQAFVTSDDRYVGEDVSRLDGSYTCGVETIAGVQHYLVAYKAGSPDIAGTTVNTLTSTNVDGT